MDTPGLLDRPAADRNEMERLTYASLAVSAPPSSTRIYSNPSVHTLYIVAIICVRDCVSIVVTNVVCGL